MAAAVARLDRALVAFVAAGTASVAVTLVLVLATDLPVAWLLLAITGAMLGTVVAWAWRNGRVLEPLPVLAPLSLGLFVLRPLQLFLGADDLLAFPVSSPPTSAVEALRALETQEVAAFATTRLSEPLEDALTRAMLVAAAFCVFLVVGYLALRRLPYRRVAHLDATCRRPRRAIALCFALGLAGQVAIVARAGGPVAAAEAVRDQSTLNAGFALFVLASFSVAGLLVWYLWQRPRDRAGWVLFGVALAETSGFYLLAGSRARAMLPLFLLLVARHFGVRPWRLRTLVAMGLSVALAATAFLAVRQASADRAGWSVAEAVPRYLSDPGPALNDNTSFDNLFMLTTVVGRESGHKHGGAVLDALHSYVPGAIAPDKPESGDIEFRRLIWGESQGGGRPYTVAGELYYDAGLALVIVGALLLGALLAAVPRLLAPGFGQPYRVGLYAITLFVLVELLVGGYAIAIGFALLLGIPYLVAVHLLGR